jgi:hypothetical protein
LARLVAANEEAVEEATERKYEKLLNGLSLISER